MRIEIDDPDDPRIHVFQGLRDHVLRQRREQPGGDVDGVFVAEGDIVVERALRAGYQLISLLIDGKRTKPMPAVVPESIPLYACTPNVLQKITGYHLHRGVIACFARRALMTPDDALQGATTIAVAEGISNPTNLGVILRCAAGLSIDAYLLDKSCCDPLYRRCGRVSMGEAYTLPYARLDPFPQGLQPVIENGFKLVGLTPNSSAVALGDLKVAPDDKLALLLGAEGPGLTQETLDACDYKVRIPMAGVVDSINVGSAAAVAFYAIAEARKRF